MVKVGDKVCVTKAGDNADSGHGASIGDVFTVTRTFDDDGCVDTDPWFFFEDEYEPVAVAGSNDNLTIREGAYYLTRDGRKVGPMVAHDYYFEDDRRYSYYPNGERLAAVYGDEIIAEWPAYNANPAAEGDNLRDEYGPVGTAANDNGTASKFKVGDKVNYAWSRNCWQGVKITEFRNGMYMAVDPKLGRGAFTEEMLEHASPAIVALIENGQPKPAERPFVHPNREAASKEARRLAGKHRGREFGVYELVDTAQEEAEHEWQRLALAGRVTDAVSALVKQSGIGLQVAYFAVRQAA